MFDQMLEATLTGYYAFLKEVNMYLWHKGSIVRRLRRVESINYNSWVQMEKSKSASEMTVSTRKCWLEKKLE